MKRDWLHARAAASPQAPAVWVGEHIWTYADLDGLADQFCAHLTAAGLPANGRVGILMPNRLEYVALVHALARLGAVLVPLNIRLTPPELAWQLAQSECHLLIHDETAAGKVRQLAAVQPLSLSDLQTARVQGATHPTSHQNAWDLERCQAIVFTSGTTGRPKGVELTFGNHFYSAMASAYRLGLDVNDLWLSCLPLYHVGGLAVIFRSCLYGTAVDLHARFDLEAINHSLDTKPITLASFVPTMLYRLMQTRETWPKSLRLILLGGAAASPELIATCLARHIPVSTTYGMTEAGSQIATLRPEGVARKPGSVGRPLLFTSVKIMGDDGSELPANTYGEIAVRGPHVTPGYVNNPEANAERFRDGWFYTGDIGYVDAEGDLWLVQRRSDLIVSGGENVYPAEVEAVLRRHPAVQAVCVVGLPDPEWGQRVAAMIQRKPGATLTQAELAAFGREHLAGYKRPRLIHFVAQLPQTASGKIERRAVAELMERAARPVEKHA